MCLPFQNVELNPAPAGAQLKWPLAMVVNGESVLDAKLRMANIELINTLGVFKANLTACLECHCPGEALLRVSCLFSSAHVMVCLPALLWSLLQCMCVCCVCCAMI